ncbi:hypothetical protein THAOC_00611, partial [Thalassiosira oceanica]
EARGRRPRAQDGEGLGPEALVHGGHDIQRVRPRDGQDDLPSGPQGGAGGAAAGHRLGGERPAGPPYQRRGGRNRLGDEGRGLRDIQPGRHREDTDRGRQGEAHPTGRVRGRGEDEVPQRHH